MLITDYYSKVIKRLDIPNFFSWVKYFVTFVPFGAVGTSVTSFFMVKPGRKASHASRLLPGQFYIDRRYRMLMEGKMVSGRKVGIPWQQAFAKHRDIRHEKN